MEKAARKSFNVVVGGHKLLSEKMERIDAMTIDMDEIKCVMAAIEAVVAKSHSGSIEY